MYYNTNNESGETLQESRTNSRTQNELILHIFSNLRDYDEGLTPDEINDIISGTYNKTWPITSIRRAISTLTDQAKLTKTNNLREGKYGKKTHIWKYNSIQHITQIRNDINDTNTPGQRINRL